MNTDVDVSQLTEEDIDNMDPAKLAEIDVEDSEEEADKPEDKTTTDKDGGADTDPTTTDEAGGTNDSDEDGEGSKDKPKGDPETDKEDGEPQGPEKALKDTQRAFHEKAQEVAKLKRELEAKKLELEKAKLEKDGGFKKLSEDELAELRIDDPDEYIKYRDALKEHEEKVQQLEATAVTSKAEEAGRANLTNAISVFAELNGWDLSKVTDPYDQSQYPPEVAEFFRSADFQKFDKFVTDTFVPNEEGVYTAETLKNAHFLMNRDTILAERQLDASRKTVDAIKRAANGGSRLDTVPKDKSDTTQGLNKPASEYTQQEIEEMGDKQFALYEEALAREEAQKDG